MQLGHSVVNVELGASVETMWAPGALTSGLAKPSCVSPRLDHDAKASSLLPWVPLSSTAPPEMTNGSLPGAHEAASALVPRLPAAATTTTPFSPPDSTA